jgi:hypothetical protein
MRITQGDHIIDRRTGERLRFSCWKSSGCYAPGIVAVCLVPGQSGRGRVRQVPIDRVRKVKRWRATRC